MPPLMPAIIDEIIATPTRRHFITLRAPPLRAAAAPLSFFIYDISFLLSIVSFTRFH